MKLIVIPDTHFPFADQEKIYKAIQIVRGLKPDAVIQIGDLYDQWSFNKFPRDPSSIKITPQEEAHEGREMAESMWEDIHRASPRSKLFQLSGNHDVRVVKRMVEKNPESGFIAKEWLSHQMQFNGVETVQDEFVLDNIMFMHGMRKAGEHAKYNQMNTITGHTHKARIEYFANRFGPYWEMNCGWLGNKESPVFSYRAQKKIDDTQSGIGVVEDGQPRFILL